MSRGKQIFYSALMLTGVNLLLRFVGTSFQVYISSVLGAAGVGLLQLVLSVGGLAMVAGIAGIRTATMYLTAEELGRNKRQNITWILSAGFLYSIVCSGTLAATLYCFAPQIAQLWIGDVRTVEALRLFAAFLPVSCLCSVMTGYFTAANRIGTLAAVEIAEQLASMAVTMAALQLWAGSDPGRSCMSVILGSCTGACLTLGCLVFLRIRETPLPGTRIPIRSRLIRSAVPLGFADILKSGINTLENLMVPKRLAMNRHITDPLAAFGTVGGQVFPILMFPACILFGLAELLIPELARCNAAGSRGRIRYLVRRSLKVSMLYGTVMGGFLFLLAEPLCDRFYRNPDAGKSLKLYAILVPMLYCDAITDAMTKGLGQQKACVRYNILTSAMDVIFLYLLLPSYGMEGYFVSFLITHLLNFLLSLRRLFRISGVHLPMHIPMLTFSAALVSLWSSSYLLIPGLRCCAYVILLICTLFLLKILQKEDTLWLKKLIVPEDWRKSPGRSAQLRYL